MNIFHRFVITCCLAGLSISAPAQELPFEHSIEVYRSEDGRDMAFALRLEQPFLAEEFEKSNYLRLRSNDSRAHLIYPKETKFQQKHAEFYGRLRGQGVAELQLSYETVAENLDGSRNVKTTQGTIAVAIPQAPATREEVGSRRIFLDWARQQNNHFARLLQYYPHETFFQYCLLQSKARYGVDPPPIPMEATSQSELETELYELFTGSLAIQESLQRQTLSASGGPGDYNTHVSTIQLPRLKSLDYEKLLDEKRERDQIQPQPHEIARLVPSDQYFVHFNSMKSLGEALDLALQWGDNLLRLYTLQSQDNRLQAKLEEQLVLRRDILDQFVADKIITEVAVTGSDPYALEGTDVTLILRVDKPDLFSEREQIWVSEARKTHPHLVEQEFNYRGHKVVARYTNDRVVSSFFTRQDDYFVYSNSHRGVRHVIDAAVGVGPSLHEALDYRYVTALLPPSELPNAGYFFASEDFVRRTIGPSAKISQKRRLECFNNLVMQNNASMFFRLEYGRSPNSLSEMIQQRFIDPARIVCPHGGAYTFDAERDTCTCSLHNRLRYLTPNRELTVLNVSKQEAAEYQRYKQRYERFWQKGFDPIAIRITMANDVKLETCVLPFANSSIYSDLRQLLDKNPQPIDTSKLARSAVASLITVPGRKRTAAALTMIPGISEIIQDDPTLTDLSWLGDRVSLHFCDGEIILGFDPTLLRPIDVPMLGKAPAVWQAAVAMLLMTANMPVYATVDVENIQKAERLLEQFSQRVFLKRRQFANLPLRLDSYRLPDYRDHPIHVLSIQLHAATIRLHLALVDNHLVLATKPEILREVIDASAADRESSPTVAHALLRLDQRGLHRLEDDVQLYWAEKSRVACHRNIISIYNLHKLYDAPLAEVARLSEAKYGVRFYCPEEGDYTFDRDRNQIVCSIHGNRESSRQQPELTPDSSFAKFLGSLDAVVASLRFEEDALIATVEIDREDGH